MSEPKGTYATHVSEPEPAPPPRPATIRDLRANLESLHVPRGTGSHQDYESAKRILSCWLRHLASEGIEAPSYEACIRECARHTGV